MTSVVLAVSGRYVAGWVLQAYAYVLIARALVSWFPITHGSPIVPVVRVLERLTEPVLAPIRRVVPPVQAGGMGIDLSIIIAILGLFIIGRVVLG